MQRRRRSGRRLPWWALALSFVVVPVLEIYVLIQVGQVIGAWWTVLLLIADGFLGSWLMKREGTRAWVALQDALRGGRVPGRELADAALILAGGTLLLAPGFLTDLAGLFCVLPLTRPVARKGLSRFLTRRLTSAGPVPAGPTGPSPGRTRSRPGPDEAVVQGEGWTDSPAGDRGAGPSGAAGGLLARWAVQVRGTDGATP